MLSEIQLPRWLDDLRAAEIVQRVQDDPRSNGPDSILGYSAEQAKQAAGWGQAEFDEPWGSLTPQDRVLLYSYFFQIRHLRELTVAFRHLFKDGPPNNRPVVIDLGCGPFTGALALAGVFGNEICFDYIGIDQSNTMLNFGEHLVSSAKDRGEMHGVSYQKATEISSASWPRVLGWHPVLVIMSYLLASPTLDVKQLVAELNALLGRIGRGHVTLLYTNSPKHAPNRRWDDLSSALQDLAFRLDTDNIGTVKIESGSEMKKYELRYALFSRQPQNTLQ